MGKHLQEEGERVYRAVHHATLCRKLAIHPETPLRSTFWLPSQREL